MSKFDKTAGVMSADCCKTEDSDMNTQNDVCQKNAVALKLCATNFDGAAACKKQSVCNLLSSVDVADGNAKQATEPMDKTETDSDEKAKKNSATQTSTMSKTDKSVVAELAEIERFARERYIPVMLDDTKELLFKTVRERQPKRILEIGTAVGYSGIVMLSASREAKLNTMEMDENVAQIAKQNFAAAGMIERVNLFVGDARSIVLQLTGEYDFIFLDGPKGQYETFLPYLTDVLAVGGTLVCDNVLYKGLVEHVPENKRHKHITVARNMRAFLDDITTTSRYKTTLYRIGDGVTVSTKLR